MRKLMFLMLIAVGTGASRGFADALTDYQEGVEAWSNLKTQQNAPCDPSIDSAEVLTGRKTKFTVLILHGYTQNPQAMIEYINFFKKYDVNILAPRLARHFDMDIRALDKADRQEWIDQTQRAYEAAAKMGRYVIVAGYSLGGLLASRLSLNPNNSKSLAAVILLSPALRLTGNVEVGAAVAAMFSRTGNEWLKMAPPACGSATPYLSVNGGRQVVNLMRATDRGYPSVDGTVYKNIFAYELASSKPVFLAVVDGDEVVDSEQLYQMATPIPDSGYLTFKRFQNRAFNKSPHSLLTSEEVGQLEIFEPLSRFLIDWTGLTMSPTATN